MLSIPTAIVEAIRISHQPQKQIRAVVITMISQWQSRITIQTRAKRGMDQKQGKIIEFRRKTQI